MKIKLSQTDWEKIGVKMGWIQAKDGKLAQSNHEGHDDPPEHNPDRTDEAYPPGELDPSFEDGDGDSDDEENAEGEFSYLTDGQEDDARMVRLRREAESLVDDDGDSSDVHAALYWLLSDYHGGQGSPEYAALSSSRYNPGPMEKGPRGSAKYHYDQLKSVLKS